MKIYANLAGVEVGDGFPVRVVGAINVSPESFYGGSVARSSSSLQKLARRMVDEGAAVLDLGAMSTAPYVRGAIGEAQERKRLVAAVRSVKAVVDVPLSVDTQRASVAEAALEAGADIINDVSGLRADAAMGKVARRAGGVVLMASEVEPTHGEAVAMIARLLRQCLQRAVTARLSRRRIVLDPGIGFFRRAALPWHELDCAVIRDLGRLRRLGAPLLVGISRKSFIGRISGRKDPADRLYGSLAAAAIAVVNGANLVRAHDVGATVDVVRVAEALRSS